MGNIYETGENHGLALFTSGHRILCCDRMGVRFGRPVILCDDYGGQINELFFEQTIYYVYRNTDGALVLKSIASNKTLLTVPREYSPCQPRLAGCGNQLFLFCLIHMPGTDACRLVCFLPFARKEKLEIPCLLPPSARYSLCVLKQLLMIAVTRPDTVSAGQMPSQGDFSALPSASSFFFSDSPSELFCISSGLEIHSLSELFQKTVSAHQKDMEQSRQSHRIELEQLKLSYSTSLEQEKKNYQKELQKLKLSHHKDTEQKKLDYLAEQNRMKHGFESRIAQLEQAHQTELEQLKQEVEFGKAQLASAVSQYNDLMNVASRYREEAAKWHEKYLKRRTES